MLHDVLQHIDRDLRDWEVDDRHPATIRLESGLWNTLRRSLEERSYAYPGPTDAERRRPRLFGIDVVVDETLAPGTWRLEQARP